MIVPGGAGNTAANITSLGGRTYLFGLIGLDHQAEELAAALQAHHIKPDFLVADNRPTTEKIRVLGNHQQIVRIDHETKRELDESLEKNLLSPLGELELDAIVICDYAKGVVTASLMDQLRSLAQAKDIPILADVRPEHKNYYNDLTFITPNRRETATMIEQTIGTLEEAKTHGLLLAKNLETNILLTLSEEGLLVITFADERVVHLPTKAQEVIDVSGAGDTVIAALTLALASGAKPVDAARIANHAASVVVSKLGTATVSQMELLNTFANEN
jgi:D-beta-D-heptose 7-phosphate kinase/D-beta-D-heptose 1-phosphate adenosyltransferase